MLQKKPNLELAQALIDNQPKTVIFAPHPKKADVLQQFSPSFKITEEGKREIILGKSLGDFRPCLPGEKADRKIFSPTEFVMRDYVRID